MENQIIATVEATQLKTDIPEFKSGDRVRVDVRVIEGDKERIQAFEGDVIAMRNVGARSTFTVRKLSYGIGVERTFFMHSPIVKLIQLVRRGKVRRAKLYYLRDRKGKAARISEKKSKG
jgi:large subunit ribosomal protein L19